MFISENKMSKRERATINKQRRSTWSISPITRVKEDKTKYNRKRLKYYE